MKDKKRPEFICIGPQKAGTTWLYANLKKHPQVFLPNIKETRLLWERKIYPNNSFLYRLSKYNKEFQFREINRKLIKRTLINIFNLFRLRLSTKDFFWEFKYFFCKHTDDLYNELFATRNGQISGDISPQYWQRLNREDIKELSNTYPDLKIIFILRDPVERIWSHAKHCLLRHPDPFRKSKTVTKEDYYVFFNDNVQYDYLKIINDWKTFFPDDQFYLEFFDNIEKQPANTYRSVCDFLGIKSDLANFNNIDIKKVVNKGIKKDIPFEYAAYIFPLVKGQVNGLRIINELYPTKWVEKWKFFINNNQE